MPSDGRDDHYGGHANDEQGSNKPENLWRKMGKVTVPSVLPLTFPLLWRLGGDPFPSFVREVGGLRNDNQVLLPGWLLRSEELILFCSKAQFVFLQIVDSTLATANLSAMPLQFKTDRQTDKTIYYSGDFQH